MNMEECQSLLDNKFGLCGCTETDLIIDAIIKVMQNATEEFDKGRLNYNELFKETALFYIVAGILTNEDYMEHGTAIRCSWLTEQGKELLTFLKENKNALCE